jgi:hypothetical protein
MTSVGLLAASVALVVFLLPRRDPIAPASNSVPNATAPIAAARQTKRAEREVLAVFHLVHAVGQRSAEEALEQGVSIPARKLSLALLNSTRLPKDLRSALLENAGLTRQP